MRDRVSEARKDIPKATLADPYLLNQACNEMESRLENLQRLTRPGKKDFGIYGGLVSCAVFCLLLVVAAIVNRAYKLGANATVVFGACTPLAVLAGYGLAGLRVWKGASKG